MGGAGEKAIAARCLSALVRLPRFKKTPTHSDSMVGLARRVVLALLAAGCLLAFAPTVAADPTPEAASERAALDGLGVGECGPSEENEPDDESTIGWRLGPGYTVAGVCVGVAYVNLSGCTAATDPLEADAEAERATDAIRGSRVS